MAGLGDHGVELDAPLGSWMERIVQAIYGRKTAGRRYGDVNRAGDRVLANPLALYWAIVIVFLQRDLERPSLNELTEPDDARAALGLLVLS